MSRPYAPAIWALMLVAAPLAYVIYTKSSYDARTSISCVVLSSLDPNQIEQFQLEVGGDRKEQTILSPEVLARPREWVVAQERVLSNPVPLTNMDRTLAQGASQGLVEVYMRTTMGLFARTPQAWFMRRIIGDPGVRRTFDAEYLDRCDFEVGDRVCGVYVVTSRTQPKNRSDGGTTGGEMVVLSLSPPEGWAGPVVRGSLIVGYNREGHMIQLINETVLWREKKEKPVFLEGVVGRWAHSFMVQWMVLRGLEALTASRIDVRGGPNKRR
ncbi:hypothetical protein TruAng_001833 [Truncatella angustata]|nr:hypothetical protein TruAng_001833 [Truncatella angustata]